MKYKNYRNIYTNDNRIYSHSDLYNMPLGEFLRRKKELLSQYRVLGIPKDEELDNSENVVHVKSYTREDGTEVKSHYRSKPNGGGVHHEAEVKDENKIETEEKETKQENKETQKEQKEETPETEEQRKEKMMYPDEVAGVKRGEPMTPEKAGGKNVNPNFDSDDEGYKYNCTSCVPVHKARELGYDVEALPAKADEDGQVKMLRRYPYYAFEPKEGEKNMAPTKIRSNNAEECIQQLQKEVNQGECYEFWYHPQNTEDGYAHTVELSKNSKNELQIYDPQSGETYGREYFEKIDFSKIEDNQKRYYPQFLYRIDNKIPKYDLLEKISKPSQRNIK